MHLVFSHFWSDKVQVLSERYWHCYGQKAFHDLCMYLQLCTNTVFTLQQSDSKTVSILLYAFYPVLLFCLILCVLNLSLVFDILDIVCSGMWKMSLQGHYLRNAGHMKQVFRHTIFVLQLFIMEMKQMYIWGGVGGGVSRRISPYIKTVLPMGGQEGSQNFKNCVS